MIKPIIYNKKTEHLLRPAFIRVGRNINFSVGAMEMMGITAGMKLHILDFGEGDLFFMLDTDKNGFHIRIDRQGKAQSYACGICKMLKRLVGVFDEKENVCFIIEKTSLDYNNKKLWKINTKKRYTP